jgi:hypothetical protein
MRGDADEAEHGSEQETASRAQGSSHIASKGTASSGDGAGSL